MPFLKGAKARLIRALKVDACRGMDPDSIHQASFHAAMLERKPPLKAFYADTYRHMVDLRQRFLPEASGREIEIGSGGGFFREIRPRIWTTDIRPLPGVNGVLDACRMPFRDGSIAAIYVCFSLHHIPRVREFLKEASRVLKPGGGIIATEPYWGPMGKVFFSALCDEPYLPQAPTWEFESLSPMSDSNQALSYILLERDREVLEREFPSLRVVYQRPFPSLRYLLAGALCGPQFLPTPLFGAVRRAESLLSASFFLHWSTIFHAFVLRKDGDGNGNAGPPS